MFVHYTIAHHPNKNINTIGKTYIAGFSWSLMVVVTTPMSITIAKRARRKSMVLIPQDIFD